MPASNIAQISLRIFALYWALIGLVELLTMYFMSSNLFYSINLVAPLIFAVAGIVLWLVAPGLSLALARRNDGEFKLTGIKEKQLYTAAFLALGLYFVISSFPNVINWIHFFSIHQAPEYGFNRNEEPSYYDLAESGLTLLAGLAVLLTAKKLAAKLTGRTNDKSNDPDRSATTTETSEDAPPT